MPHRENIDPEYDDEFNLEPTESVTAVVPEVDYNDLQCKYCLRRGMHWEKDKSEKYYLALPSGRRHTCREKLTGFVKLPKLRKPNGKKGL